MTSTHDTGARNGFAGIQALSSREPGYSVAQKCLAVQSAAEQLNPTLRTEAGVRLADDAWSWYVGALGEIEVGAILARLSSQWFVRHAVPIGEGTRDVDHLLVGPNGVFVLNTKRHEDAKIWVGDHVMRVNGTNVRHLNAAKGEANDVRRRLESKVRFPVLVYSAIVTVGEWSLKDSRDPDSRFTAVVSSDELVSWILSQPATLSPTSLELIRLAAEEPDTWHIDPHAAETSRVMPRFQRLRLEVGEHPSAPGREGAETRPTVRRPARPRTKTGTRRTVRTAPVRARAAKATNTRRGTLTKPVRSRGERVFWGFFLALIGIPIMLTVAGILISELITVIHG